MKIQRINGCINFSLNVDGQEEINMTHEERLQVIDKIYNWMKETADENLNIILQVLTGEFGEYHQLSEKPCECCGDIVDEYILEIN